MCVLTIVCMHFSSSLLYLRLFTYFAGSRIDDLEKSISDLMNQAGIEPDATPFDENEEKK